MAHKLDIGPDDVHAPSEIKTMPTLAPNRKARRAAAKNKVTGKAAPEVAEKPGVGVVRRKGLHFRIGLANDGSHQIEVMHAAAEQADVICHGDPIAIEPESVSLADGVDAPRWNQIAKVGDFAGHPAGRFSLSPAIFADIVRNYTEIDGGNVAFDFEHASEGEETAGSIPQEGAPAQGWIKQLANRGADGLWGLVEWLEPAKSYIREGKYKFLSPAIRFGAKHPATGAPIGARLTSVAITNRPFLRSMQPLMASDKPGDTMLNKPLMSANAFMPRIKAALKLHELATPAECKDQLDRLRELCAMGAGPGSMAMGVSLDDYLAPMGAMMNLNANATVEDLLDAVEEMIEAAIAQHVEDFHEGAAMTDGGVAATTTTENANMAELTDKDLAVKLGEEKARADRATTENAGLALRLKDAEATAVDLTAKVNAKDATIAERDATIVSLKADIAKRDDDAATARVQDAFETYKDAKKLTDDNRAQMLITLRADSTLFDKLYPRVAPNQKHLLADLTGSRMPNGSTAPGQQTRVPVGAPGAAPSSGNATSMMLTLKDKYIKDGVDPEEAFKRAIRETRASN